MERCGETPALAAGLPLYLRSRVREPTLKRYQHSVRLFLLWAFRLHVVLLSAHDLDMALMHYAHSGDVTKSNFNLTLAAVVFFLPGVGGTLPYTRATLKGWNRYLPAVHKTPMVFIFVVACARNLVQFGFPRLAAGLLVQFAGFLRPGELIALRREDVTLPELVRAAGIAREPFALLALGTAARGTKVNRRQVAKVRHPWAIDALRWLHRSTRAKQTLVQATYAEYRRALDMAASRAGFKELRFLPHCPRAGAATQGSLDGRSVPDLMADGRWSNEQSLKIYLDVATAIAARTMHLAEPFTYLLRDRTQIGPIFCSA